MKSYDVQRDLQRIILYFGLTLEELASALNISLMSISRYLNGTTYPEEGILEKIYGFAYSKGLRLNQAKADFFFEDKKGKTLLFHGASREIDGEIDNKHSCLPNDFGMGFYVGESLTQSSAWVCEDPLSSIYCYYFDGEGQKKLTFETDRDWMYAILYYRGAFQRFEPTKEVKDLIDRIEESDYLIAPIADNQMYRILNRFADNEITDEQCIHALAMTNLGKQYVMKSMDACRKLEFVERLYLCREERVDDRQKRIALSMESESKAELALIEYRRKGKYFDELFKRIG